MPSNHEELKRRAIKAINEVFSDRSVSAKVTLESLEELATELDMCMESVEEQMEGEQD